MCFSGKCKYEDYMGECKVRGMHFPKDAGCDEEAVEYSPELDPLQATLDLLNQHGHRLSRQ